MLSPLFESVLNFLPSRKRHRKVTDDDGYTHDPFTEPPTKRSCSSVDGLNLDIQNENDTLKQEYPLRVNNLERLFDGQKYMEKVISGISSGFSGFKSRILSSMWNSSDSSENGVFKVAGDKNYSRFSQHNTKRELGKKLSGKSGKSNQFSYNQSRKITIDGDLFQASSDPLNDVKTDDEDIQFVGVVTSTPGIALNNYSSVSCRPQINKSCIDENKRPSSHFTPKSTYSSSRSFLVSQKPKVNEQFRFTPTNTPTITSMLRDNLQSQSKSILNSSYKIPKISKTGGIQKPYSAHKIESSMFGNKRKSSRQMEDIRLDEKSKYQELIKLATAQGLTVCEPSHRMSNKILLEPLNVSKKCGGITRTHLSPERTNEHKFMHEQGLVRRPLHSSVRSPSISSLTSSFDTNRSSVLEDNSNTRNFIDLIDDDSDPDCIVVCAKVKSKTLNAASTLERKVLEPAKDIGLRLKYNKEKFNERNIVSALEAVSCNDSQRQYSEIRTKMILLATDKLTKRMKYLDLKYPKTIFDLEAVPDAFPELTPEMEDLIEQCFDRGPPNQVLTEKFNIQITRKDIATLKGLNWLNDEVINFYMNLLMERSRNEKLPRVYAFNTFFYPKILKTGFSSIKRWTKKIDIFSHNYVLFPIHLGVHWCLAVADMQKTTINYYDSMLGDNDRCLEVLLDYLEAEYKDKKGNTYDTNDWITVNVKNIPQQMNGSDCGMFACKFAECLSRNAEITFTQDNMGYFRRRMVFEIVSGKLL